ncbi:SGNH/GDSL hydrolase family protein [Chitinimonas sp.]|uniref:SGNH/GDSL hydrolase family protein n=1 Tax=Chitinimonas sp. TaxID=1934313 RepID=UPI0035ADD747
MEYGTLRFAIPLTLLAASLASLAAPAQPDPKLSHYLSANGPELSDQQIKQLRAGQAQAMGFDSRVRAMGSSTYTYLRCFYRTGNNPKQPGTNYVWGLDPSSGGYFRIYGSWWSGGLLAWQNMFYSDISQERLQSVCQSTLAAKGIQQPVAMAFAADNSLSFNYTVWSNDSAIQGKRINKIVAFGDSLSDNMNMYNESLWKLPNKNSWYIGHFSNGYNWVEYLAQDLKLPLYNWAVGGAAVTTKDLVIRGVVEQVDSWKQYMQKAPAYQPQNTLFTILIGGNDLINYGSSVDTVMQGETRAVQNLINAGARNILLVKLPDVSHAPVFKYKGNAATVAAQVVDLNRRLDDLVASLKAQYGSSLNIELFDSYALFNDLLARPASYGVSNTSDACLDINADSSLNYLSSHPARSSCSNPDNFVFWDTLHPTTHTHKLLGERAARFVQSNFVNLQ